ncbi:MAG: VOC family protein [Chloroflexi bacterium]|nr:VOC family protein [Chloroflexota bacterium]
MAEVTKHLQGMPCWVELATTDEKAALRFYSALFGWKDNPQPMGPGSFCHMQQVRGLEAAAIYQQGEEEKKQRVPPHWTTYLAVTSADETAKKAKQAGGKVLVEPFDVFNTGRMAMVQDPQGAVFGLWQAKQHIGYRIVSEPGALTWNELLTTDPGKATAFYTSVLGVSAARMPGPMDYTILKAAGKDAAGVMQITPEMGPIPPNWFVYFMVADVDASAKQVQSLSGRVLVAPRDIPGVGRFATVQDGQGAVFGIFKG